MFCPLMMHLLTNERTPLNFYRYSPAGLVEADHFSKGKQKVVCSGYLSAREATLS